MTKPAWNPISTAPFGQDIELAVLEGAETHAVVARCRRAPYGWINATTGRPIDVNPTHWREWQDL